MQINSAIRLVGMGVILQCMCATLVAGQSSTDLRVAADDVAGCYEITPTRNRPGWLRSIERRVWLTSDKLARDTGSASSVFVARPAPGQRAASYSSSRWTVVDSGNRIAIRWDLDSFSSSSPFGYRSRTVRRMKGRQRTPRTHVNHQTLPGSMFDASVADISLVGTPSARTRDIPRNTKDREHDCEPDPQARYAAR